MKFQRLANWHLASVGVISAVLLTMGRADTQQLQGKALVRALQQGGYVIVMRHASSPQNPPTKENADPQNIHLERQLDESGRAAATAFGNALRRLKIPVGRVLSSPTYRARETARDAQLPNPMVASELGDNGRSMQNTNESQSVWLQAQVTKFPRVQHHPYHPPTQYRRRFPAVVCRFVRWRSPYFWFRRQRRSQTGRESQN